jgi:hypothetical protein
MSYSGVLDFIESYKKADPRKKFNHQESCPRMVTQLASRLKSHDFVSYNEILWKVNIEIILGDALFLRLALIAGLIPTLLCLWKFAVISAYHPNHSE